MILNIVDLFLKTLLFTLKPEIVYTVTKKMDCLIPNSFIFHFGMIERAMMLNLFEVKDCAMTGKKGEGARTFVIHFNQNFVVANVTPSYLMTM